MFDISIIKYGKEMFTPPIIKTNQLVKCCLIYILNLN